MNTETIIVLRSVTHSMKAKNVLAAHGIKARTVKPPSSKDKGCAYGIAVAYSVADKASGILWNNNIPIVKTVN